MQKSTKLPSDLANELTRLLDVAAKEGESAVRRELDNADSTTIRELQRYERSYLECPPREAKDHDDRDDLSDLIVRHAKRMKDRDAD